MPLVSIVLPTHNGERYLAQSIESCLAQTHRDLELIVVDDCSTDSTPQIARRYADADPRVRVLRNDPNRKLPASLNRGFTEAKGAYLTWTSDDNWYRPEAIAAMAAVLDTNADVGLVYAAMTDVDDTGAELKHRVALPPESLVEWNCVGACFLYRREVRERIGDYAVDLYLAEDYDYWLRVYTEFEVRSLDRDLYAYRWHAGSLTSKHTERVREVARQVVERALPRLRERRPAVALRAELVLAQNALEAGDTGRARASFFSALRRHPLRTWTRLDGPRLPVTAFCGAWVGGRLAALRRRGRSGTAETL